MEAHCSPTSNALSCELPLPLTTEPPRKTTPGRGQPETGGEEVKGRSRLSVPGLALQQPWASMVTLVGSHPRSRAQRDEAQPQLPIPFEVTAVFNGETGVGVTSGWDRKVAA